MADARAALIEAVREALFDSDTESLTDVDACIRGRAAPAMKAMKAMKQAKSVAAPARPMKAMKAMKEF